MNGPFPMTQAVILTSVPRSPGAYVLGTVENRALYVGRAESLRDGLLSHFVVVGPNTVPVQRFWYAMAVNAWEAYRLECTWYHQFSPTHNAVHPTRPPLSPAGCPVCGR